MTYIRAEGLDEDSIEQSRADADYMLWLEEVNSGEFFEGAYEEFKEYSREEKE